LKNPGSAYFAIPRGAFVVFLVLRYVGVMES
jgi:hypothetical protein